MITSTPTSTKTITILTPASLLEIIVGLIIILLIIWIVLRQRKKNIKE